MGYLAAGMRADRPFEEVISVLSSAGIRAVVMDPDYIAGADHMLAAAMHAERAFARGTARSKTFETEVMLYCAWERQIGKAMDRMRPKEWQRAFAVLVEDGDPDFASLGFVRDDSVISVDAAKAARLGLTDPFLSPEDQAVENVASVDLLKA